MIDESFLKLVNFDTLRSAHDSEAAEFWQAMVHHIISIVDHKMATIEQSAEEIAKVLLHEMREGDIVGDARFARLELQAFLTRCFKLEPTLRCKTYPPQGKYYYFLQKLQSWLPNNFTKGNMLKHRPSICSIFVI